MRDELHAENLRTRSRGLLRATSRQLNTAAFAAAAGVYLRLHDNDVCAQFAGGGFGLVRCSGDNAARNRNAVFFENGFSLIFVDLHNDAVRLP